MSRLKWIAPLAVGLVGAVIGLAVAAGTRLHPEPLDRPATKTWKPVSQLGHEPSPTERQLQSILDQAQRRQVEHAQSLDQEGRRRHILDLVKSDKNPARWGWLKRDRFDLLLDLKAHILPEDVPGLLALCQEAGPELNLAQWKFLIDQVSPVAGAHLNIADILAWPNQGMRREMLKSHLDTIAERDPFAALAALEDKALIEGLQYGVDLYFAKAAELDPLRAMAAAEKLAASETDGSGYNLRNSAYTGILGIVAQRQGLDKALKLVDKVKPAKDRAAVRRDLYVHEAYRSEEARDAVLKRLMEPGIKVGERNNTLAGILQHMGHVEPEKALAWIEANADALKIKTSGARTYSYGEEANLADARWQILGKLAERNPAKALENALAQKDPALRLEYLHPAMSAIAGSDARKAAEIMATLTPAEQAKMRPSLVSSWTDQDAPAAAKYVESLSEGPAREAVMDELMYGWASVDAPAASTWLDHQPAGPAKDRGISSMISHIQRNDPEAAGAWTFQVSDAQLRAQLQRDLVMSAFHRKREAALAWIQKNSAALGPEQTASLQKVVNGEK